MNWYAVNVKRGQEGRVEQGLQLANLEIFSPRLKQSRILRGKRQVVVQPLFPGYLFARFDFERHVRMLSYTRGVRRVVSFGDSPAIVDEDVISAMRMRLENGFVVVEKPAFRMGQVVRINDGPLVGLEAVFEREMDDKERVVLLLRALSYQARVIVSRSAVVNL